MVRTGYLEFSGDLSYYDGDLATTFLLSTEAEGRTHRLNWHRTYGGWALFRIPYPAKTLVQEPELPGWPLPISYPCGLKRSVSVSSTRTVLHLRSKRWLTMGIRSVRRRVVSGPPKEFQGTMMVNSEKYISPHRPPSGYAILGCGPVHQHAARRLVFRIVTALWMKPALEYLWRAADVPESRHPCAAFRQS